MVNLNLNKNLWYLMEDVDNWQLKFQSCRYSDELLNKLLQLNSVVNRPVDIHEIKKAIYYARKYHGSQMRQSGEPYYSHPLEVASMVSDYILRTDLIVTSILHDCIEDTELTKERIASIFGQKVADQVEDLTRIKGNKKIASAEMLDSLLDQKKYDIMLIKIFDRVHNVKTIGAKSPEKAKKIIEETIKYFLVLCDLIDLPAVSDELYEICREYNIKLGVIENDHFVFGKSFTPQLPFVQNKLLP